MESEFESWELFFILYPTKENENTSRADNSVKMFLSPFRVDPISEGSQNSFEWIASEYIYLS